MCDLLCLDCLTENEFNVHPGWNTNQHFIPVNGVLILHCVSAPALLILSSLADNLGCFRSAVGISAAVSIQVHVFSSMTLFTFLGFFGGGVYLGVEFLYHYANFTSHMLNDPKTVSHSGCSTLSEPPTPLSKALDFFIGPITMLNIFLK
jgi:hypothetical protein